MNRHSKRRAPEANCSEPTASWTERWINLSPEDRNALFAHAAECALLTPNQMEQLLQGIPPEPSAWPSTGTYLGESEAVVLRLRHDMRRSHFPNAASPQEFAAWCDHHNQELHPAFVSRLKELQEMPLPAPMQQGTSNIVWPSWAPLSSAAMSSNAPKQKHKQRGRPKTAWGRNAGLASLANDILLDAAKSGVVLTCKAVAQELACCPAAAGLQPSSIERHLRGHLRTEQAKVVAANARKQGKKSGQFHPFYPLDTAITAPQNFRRQPTQKERT